MKEYFFLSGKDQNGPFTLEQLHGQDITSQTMIWAEGMDKWQKLKDIPELAREFGIKILPPPIPELKNEDLYKSKKATYNKNSTDSISSSPANPALIWLIIWCSLHLFALLMSYSYISPFNNSYTANSSKFWPFVDFSTTTTIYDIHSTINPIINTKFNGIFTEYDWTEFAFYAGIAVIYYTLNQLSKKPQSKSVVK
jgi:hypothetical protein